VPVSPLDAVVLAHCLEYQHQLQYSFGGSFAFSDIGKQSQVIEMLQKAGSRISTQGLRLCPNLGNILLVKNCPMNVAGIEMPDEVALRSLLALFHGPVSLHEAEAFKELIGRGAEVWPFAGRIRVRVKRESNVSFLNATGEVRKKILDILWGPDEPVPRRQNNLQWRRDDFIRELSALREPWRCGLNWSCRRLLLLGCVKGQADRAHGAAKLLMNVREHEPDAFRIICSFI